MNVMGKIEKMAYSCLNVPQTSDRETRKGEGSRTREEEVGDGSLRDV